MSLVMFQWGDVCLAVAGRCFAWNIDMVMEMEMEEATVEGHGRLTSAGEPRLRIRTLEWYTPLTKFFGLLASTGVARDACVRCVCALASLAWSSNAGFQSND